MKNMSLLAFLDDPLKRRSLELFCEKEQNIENIHFIDDVRKYQKIFSDEKRKLFATHIITKYILVNSEEELNIMENLKQTIIEKHKNDDIDAYIFDSALKSVIFNFKLDAFYRYLEKHAQKHKVKKVSSLTKFFSTLSLSSGITSLFRKNSLPEYTEKTIKKNESFVVDYFEEKKIRKQSSFAVSVVDFSDDMIN